MILDKQTLLFDNTRVCAASLQTNSLIYDLGDVDPQVPHDPEFFHDATFFAQVTELFAGSANALHFIVIASNDVGFGSYEDIMVTPPILKALLVPGFNNFGLTVPREFNKRYLRLVATASGGSPITFETSGRITAGIVLARQTNR